MSKGRESEGSELGNTVVQILSSRFSVDVRLILGTHTEEPMPGNSW